MSQNSINSNMPVGVDDGGTGADNAADARTNLDAQQDISGLALSSATVAATDKVLIQDADDSDILKTVTAQSIANLAPAGAPTDATYITQTPNGSLSNEQAMSTLATGIVKNTTGTGVQSIAVQGTDYYEPGGADVAVADGGSGRSTATAYAVICGGTTSTNPHQSIASVGTTAQVLTSNGAGALPSFQAVPNPSFYQAATAGVSAGLILHEPTAFGTNTVTIRTAGTGFGSNYELSLPVTSGNAGFLWLGTAGQFNEAQSPYASGEAMTNSTATFIPSVGVMLSTTQAGSLTVGSLHHPRSMMPVGSSLVTNRFVFNLGTGGTGNTAGMTLADDTIYCFPFLVPYGNYNQLRVNVETADASGTADLEASVFLAAWVSSNNRFGGARIFDPITVSDISTTGEKTFDFGSNQLLSGWVWVVLRADNIGTALSLGTSSNVYPDEVRNVFGANLSTDSFTPAYGYRVGGQASFPSTLTNVAPVVLITAAVGLAMRLA